jgi:hypothetical protein
MCGPSVRTSVESKFLMYGCIRIRAAHPGNPNDTLRFKTEIQESHRILGDSGIVCRYFQNGVQTGVTVVPPRSGYTGMYLKNFIPLVS